MTRGKYAKKAEIRRDREALVTEARSSATTAQRAERELATARARLASQEKAAQTEIRALRRMIDEGTSPKLEQMAAQNNALRRQRDEAARQEQANLKACRRIFKALHDRLCPQLGHAEFGRVLSESVGDADLSRDEANRLLEGQLHIPNEPGRDPARLAGRVTSQRAHGVHAYVADMPMYGERDLREAVGQKAIAVSERGGLIPAAEVAQMLADLAGLREPGTGDR